MRDGIVYPMRQDTAQGGMLLVNSLPQIGVPLV